MQRRDYVGCSEASTFFYNQTCGCYLHPYMSSPYELFLLKKGLLEKKELATDERIFWGTLSEGLVVKGMKLMFPGEFQYRKGRFRLSKDVPGFGGTCDYQLKSLGGRYAEVRSVGILEIKKINQLRWDQAGKQPLYSWLVQLQGYLMLYKREWGLLSILVGGDNLVLRLYQTDLTIQNTIREEVTKFWEVVRSGKEYKLRVANTDAMFYKYSLKQSSDTKIVDGREAALLAEYYSLKQERSYITGREEEIKTRLTEILDGASSLRSDKYEVKRIYLPQWGSYRLSIKRLTDPLYQAKVSKPQLKTVLQDSSQISEEVQEKSLASSESVQSTSR